VSYADLPAVNATLNGLSAVFLITGYILIRQGRWQWHRRAMLAAVTTSVLFLMSYLTYHAHAGSKHFPGTGTARLVYFAILLTHTVLAAAIVPLVLMSLSRGLKRQDARHRAIARWTMPLWLYVSVTGVVVYVMLYRL
jgi:putative membrane protein